MLDLVLFMLLLVDIRELTDLCFDIRDGPRLGDRLLKPFPLLILLGILVEFFVV